MSTSLNVHSLLQARGYLNNIGNLPLNLADSGTAQHALKTDRDAFFLNGLISYVSMIHALNSKNYSWAFINSYYCVFYITKTQLALRNYSLFYHKEKLYQLFLRVGESPKRINGTSHEGVLNFFSNTFPTDYFVVNQIELIQPFLWFKKHRELINYRSNPMTDPVPPVRLFDYNKNIRQWIHTYINDGTGSYTFSEEHAYLALPTKFIDNIFQAYNDSKESNMFLTDDIFKHLSNCVKDKNGPIDIIISRLKTIRA